MTGKPCSKCKCVKPLTEFAKDGRASDGVASACKACYNALHKARYAKYQAARNVWRAQNR